MQNETQLNKVDKGRRNNLKKREYIPTKTESQKNEITINKI